MDTLTTIIFTGVSGGGKTAALRAVEDLGFYCVDNLPLSLLDGFLTTMKEEPTVSQAALVVDARLGRHLDAYAKSVAALVSRGTVLEIIYLDARDDVLVRRFSETRRRHPLSGDDLVKVLRDERRLLAPMRARAATCLDTSDLTVHQLKQLIQDRYRRENDELVVSLLSFGYRYGIPAQADLVIDVRFLRNPYFVDHLQPLTGLDPEVFSYVMSQPDAGEFVSRTESWLKYLLPRYQAEGKVYFTIAVGCTGGRHRSVAIVEELGGRLSETGPVKRRHRDIDR